MPYTYKPTKRPRYRSGGGSTKPVVTVPLREYIRLHEAAKRKRRRSKPSYR